MTRSTSRRSTVTEQDLALTALGFGIAMALCAAGGLLVVALVVSALMAGGGLSLPAASDLARLVFVVLWNPDDPGSAAGPPWSSSLGGRVGLFWTVAVVLELSFFTVAAVAAVWIWRRWGPGPPGHATRAEIARELSLDAARRTAAWTRPGMSATERRKAALEEVGAPLHRDRSGRPLCSPLENPTGTLAPTQSGKSRRDLVHKVIAAPGALLCSTTKPDLLEFAALARTRREFAGPVLVFDATGATSWPAQLRWSPIEGCHDLPTAYRRAHTMVEASAVAVEAGGGGGAGNDRVFRERATFVLAAYLLAAALYNRGIDSLVRWATTKPADLEPVSMLEQDYPQIAANLAAEIGMVARTADAVWMSVRRVIEPFLDPILRQLCSPDPGEGFSARSFIGRQGSVFLIAGEHQAAHATPLLAAFAEHWLTSAQEMALDYPTRRLDPPATAVLDELPNATPLPQLPDIVSDSAGRGVVVHWAAQSLAQLDDTFTASRARQLLDNTATLSVWGGLKDSQALHWLSTLAGHHEQVRAQHHSDGWWAGSSRASYGLETVPTLRPGDVRTLDRGQVLVLHRAVRPFVAQTVDVTERADWSQLRADVVKMRSANVLVNMRGFAYAATTELPST